MGERTKMQESLFYGFSLEDHDPADQAPELASSGETFRDAERRVVLDRHDDRAPAERRA